MEMVHCRNKGLAAAVDSMVQRKQIRVLIADDHLIARAGLSAILNAQSDMTVVAEAANGQQALKLYRQHRPDVVLMDMRMPSMSGFEATAAILREFPDARIVALSTYGGEEDIRRALKTGVHSYLTKDVPHDELILAIKTASEAERYLPSGLADTVKAQNARPYLSARELDVLGLIVRGEHNKQIAHMLNISEHTVKTHVKNILHKLGVEHRTEAATSAILRGIIHLQQ
jgi:two-component system NarL family response regulator